MSPSEVVSSTAATTGRVGSAWYFVPETLQTGRRLGLDGMRFYFLGRGGVLGDVTWPVVHSAFGYFSPALIERMWTTAAERCSVRDATQAYLGCCQDFGRARLAGVEGLGDFCDAAGSVVAAGFADSSALPLFAGFAAAPLAADLPARAMQLVSALREMRGSMHLVAVVASGLPTAVAHRLRRPEMMGTFGWEEGTVPEPTDDDRTALSRADELTDRLATRAYAALDDTAGAALAGGVDRIAAALAPLG